MPSLRTTLQAILVDLKETGLLLQSDQSLPSVVSLVTGERVKGSWWGHRKGREIFRALKELESDPDVMTSRVVSGKVTFLHRRVWNSFFAICNSRESWQTKHLSADARRVLKYIWKNEELRTDRVPESLEGVADLRRAVRELENRLLVHTEELHTEKGSHAKALKPWSVWARERGFRPRKMGVATAKEEFEEILDGLNRNYGAKGRLPWQTLERAA